MSESTDTIELVREDLRSPKELWFQKVDRDEIRDWRRGEQFDENCIAALIAKGVSEDTIPIEDSWAEFFFAGSIITTLTGKTVIPPGKSTYFLGSDMSIFVWGSLWAAHLKNPKKLNKGFMGAALRMFYPRRHDPTGPDRPYLESNFEGWWSNHRIYGDLPTGRSRGTITMGFMKKCRETFDILPPKVQESVEMVAENMPAMAEITVKRIAETFHW